MVWRRAAHCERSGVHVQDPVVRADIDHKLAGRATGRRSTLLRQRGCEHALETRHKLFSVKVHANTSAIAGPEVASGPCLARSSQNRSLRTNLPHRRFRPGDDRAIGPADTATQALPDVEDDYAIVKTRAPDETFDRTLADAALRTKYGITVVSIKRPGEDFAYATADTTVYAGDILIVVGKTRQVEAFASLS